ncbi:MAG: hypothetical protein VYA34_05620 [Myxococcota bacterium]|nr:hypothetical protein [Myxococcota bacterium]
MVPSSAWVAVCFVERQARLSKDPQMGEMEMVAGANPRGRKNIDGLIGIYRRGYILKTS